ncbi:uncharacterized protein LOC105209720 [Zeugodacus cucurbitae]|nr:uncharacterized protein LOC105209720 [Zeugodacus cucurbitae]
MQLELMRATPKRGFHIPQYWDADNRNNICIQCTDGVALALKYKEGVLLATTRAETKSYETIYKLTDKICACVYGAIGDIQQIMKMAISQIKLLEYNTEHEVPVRGVTQIIRNLLHSLQKNATPHPIYAEIIVGGVDCDGYSICHILSDTFKYYRGDYCLMGDKDGLILLDKSYNKDLTEEIAQQLAEDVMQMKHKNIRKMKFCIIDSNGVREITKESADENKHVNVAVLSDDFRRDFVLFKEESNKVTPFCSFKREILSSSREQRTVTEMSLSPPSSPIDDEKPSTSKAAKTPVQVSSYTTSLAWPSDKKDDIVIDFDFDFE